MTHYLPNDIFSSLVTPYSKSSSFAIKTVLLFLRTPYKCCGGQHRDRHLEGDGHVQTQFFPQINLWAIFNCPYGTNLGLDAERPRCIAPQSGETRRICYKKQRNATLKSEIRNSKLFALVTKLQFGNLPIAKRQFCD